MNNDIKGICLFLGSIGLAYSLFLILMVFLTGLKIVKSIVFITTLSVGLVSLGLDAQVRSRLFVFAKSKLAF